MDQPAFIAGHTHKDERGTLAFVNDFDMHAVKRFYTIFHTDTTVVRAWQGHQREQKWFFVLEGAFEILLVKPDNWQNPSAKLPVLPYQLSASQTGVLYVPGGFASGFRALAPYSKMIVYSDMKLDDSKQDDFRFEKSWWHTWD